MDLMTMILIGAGIVFLLLFISFRKQEKEQLAAARLELAEEFGKKVRRDLSEDYLRALALEEEHPGIDSISWNDLDLDRIFAAADHTISFAGQEYLYHILRNPDLDGRRTGRIVEGTVWFLDHQKEALAIRELLDELSKEEKSPFSGRFAALCQAEPGQPANYIRAGLFALFSLLLTPLVPALGVLCLFFSLVRNALIHTRTSEQYEQHFTALKDALQLIQTGRALTDRKELFTGMPSEDREGVLSELRKDMEHTVDHLAFFEKNGRLLAGTTLGTNGLAGTLMTYVNLFFLRDLVACSRLQKALQQQEDADAVRNLAEQIGYLDLVISLVSLRMSLGKTCVPEFIEQQKDGQQEGRNCWEARGLYHPLLSEPVKNNLTLEQNLLLTGSNASGKSTFLKAVAVNTLFAESLGFACADSLKLSHFRIMSSMALRDDITEGESYFLAEIRSLKRILDAAEEKIPLLCVIDEVLRGTNTEERIAASAEILQLLVRPQVTVLAATHDIELTRLLADSYRNAHFEEQIGDKDIIFPYLLKEGPATGRNAIALLGLMGFDPQAVERARKRCERS